MPFPEDPCHTASQNNGIVNMFFTFFKNSFLNIYIFSYLIFNSRICSTFQQQLNEFFVVIQYCHLQSLMKTILKFCVKLQVCATCIYNIFLRCSSACMLLIQSHGLQYNSEWMQRLILADSEARPGFQTTMTVQKYHEDLQGLNIITYTYLWTDINDLVSI